MWKYLCTEENLSVPPHVKIRQRQELPPAVVHRIWKPPCCAQFATLRGQRKRLKCSKAAIDLKKESKLRKNVHMGIYSSQRNHTNYHKASCPKERQFPVGWKHLEIWTQQCSQKIGAHITNFLFQICPPRTFTVHMKPTSGLLAKGMYWVCTGWSNQTNVVPTCIK